MDIKVRMVTYKSYSKKPLPKKYPMDAQKMFQINIPMSELIMNVLYFILIMPAGTETTARKNGINLKISTQ